MVESQYIFNDPADWQNLVAACVPLDDHESNPPERVLGAIISNLHDPQSFQDGTLLRSIATELEDNEHKEKIIKCAVTLYVNMINELQAMRLNHAKSYFLIKSHPYVLIGMFNLS